MFIYVLHNTWEDTRLAKVSDEAIMDDVPGHKEQSTCYRTRAKLAELGWWQYQPGRGTRTTIYAVQDGPVAAVMAKVKADQARRKADVQSRRAELVSGAATLQTQHKRKRQERARKPDPTLQITTQTSAADAGITPSGTPSSGATGTVQDVAPHTHEDRLCAICDSPTTFWHSASGNWICEKHRAFADEVAASLTKDEDGFVDIVPESPAAKIEDPDDFEDDIPDPSTWRASR